MDADAATPWPFALGGQVSERLEWLTDAHDPPYGLAMTLQLRRSPRVQLTFDGLESAANRRWMENLVAMRGAGLWHVPLLVDATHTTAAAAAAETSIAVDTAHRRFVAGGNAMLLSPAGARLHAVVQIASVEAGSIELAEPLASSWPAHTVIVPTIAGGLDAAPQFGRFTSDDAPYSAAFRAMVPMDWSEDFGGTVYRQLPVLDQPVFWTQDPTFRPARRTEWLDDGIGPQYLIDRAGITLPETTVEVTLVGAAEIAAHRSLLYALAGRNHPLWVPSYAHDFRLLAVHSSTTLDVEWSGYGGSALQANRRDLRIARRNAAPLYRRITGVAEVSSSVERLTLDAALPGGTVAGDIDGISFMALCRQDTDVNALRYVQPGVVQSQLSLKGCNHGL